MEKLRSPRSSLEFGKKVSIGPLLKRIEEGSYGFYVIGASQFWMYRPHPLPIFAVRILLIRPVQRIRRLTAKKAVRVTTPGKGNYSEWGHVKIESRISDAVWSAFQITNYFYQWKQRKQYIGLTIFGERTDSGISLSYRG